jgi:crossover junction endodeoxyribonuclease RuvC
MQVSEAKGVIILAAAKHQIPVFEYTPKQVKLAITGSGLADKKQIQTMITRLLRLSEIPQPDDAADGLALALCHVNWMRMK